MSNLLEKEAKIAVKGPVVRFGCLKCGCCCESLIKETKLGMLGLFLLPDEVGWFLKEKIFPLYGVGLKGNARPRPEEVIAYQLDAMVCTWFDRHQRKCMIRGMRPMVCRAYPIIHGDLQGDCKFVKQYVDEEGETLNLEPSTIMEEQNADQKILAYIKDKVSHSNALMYWPLDTRKWKLAVKKPK